MHIATNGTTIYVRSGGTGPAVVLLHGYGETGDMWVTCFRAPRVKWPCQGVKGVKFIFHRASLAPPRAVAPRTVFLARKDPRIRLLYY
jgi:pimeloyl-ACP methyl ester carboxylesterase